MTVETAKEILEKDERLRLALLATGLGMWEMDLVNNKRHWSDEALAMHGLSRSAETDMHVELNDRIMHPEDRKRLALLHKDLRNGLNDYFFEYRTLRADGEERWISARGKVLERQSAGPTRIVGVLDDVTDEKRRLLVQEHKDQQFRVLADALPQLVWIADGSGEITYYNKRRFLYFNNPKHDEVNPKWQPLVHPDDLNKTMKVWAEAMASGEEYDMEHRLQMADGSYRWHVSRATVVKSSHEKVSMWFGTATDIDRLKQAEFHVEAGVERLQVATEAAAMFAWDLDIKTGKIGWADNAATIIGCSPEQVKESQTDANFFVHPGDKDRLETEFEGFLQKKSDRFEIDFRGIAYRGKPVFWRTAGRLVRDSKGDVERAVGVTQNVTHHVDAAAQLKLLDERLMTAEEGARALVYDWDVVKNQIWRSPSLTRILGWEQDEIGSDPASWQNLKHPDDAKTSARTNFSEQLDADDHYTIEYRIRHKDGTYRWMMDSGRALRDGNRNIIRYAGTTLDITARKNMEMSQQRMSNLIELSFEPIFVWQPERGIVEWNRGAEMLYGFSRSEVLGKQPQTLLKTKYPIPFGQLMDHLQDSLNWSGEIENFDKHGNVVIVESRHQVIQFDSDAMVLETNRDIRERKRADGQVARMAAVAAASHDALYGANLDGIIEAWNPAAVSLFGYEEHEAIGQNISILAHSQKHAEQQEFLARIGAGQSVRPVDTVRKAKDGRSLDVSMAMSPVKAKDGTVVAISVALHDIGERKEWDARQRMMNRELAHRVKNSFAVLQAILRSTLKSSPDPVKFAAAFSGRLHSMSAAHDVLTANDWRGAELGALLRHQLSPYVNGQRIQLTGGTIILAPEHTAPLSLIFNELATNALNYGALSIPSGRITVSWELTSTEDGTPNIALTWTESGGPKIIAIQARSFGTTLIEKSLADATVKLDFRPDGLVCKLTWPLTIPGHSPA